jgi:lysophospholipase L1-like esterase
MILQNKKVAILGDSITEGAGTTAREFRFTDVFQSISGAEVYNYGIGGTRIARQIKPSSNPRFDLCFLDRSEEMVEGADVVVVFGGTNDFGHGDAPLGCFDDRSEYTFYGAMHSLINRLVTRYPDATVVFMTPLHRTSESVTVNEIGQPTVRMKYYVDAIREVCEYYSVPVLDLYASSGLQPAIPVIKERFMPDGLHPNNAGAKIIAERLYGFLSAL